MLIPNSPVLGIGVRAGGIYAPNKVMAASGARMSRSSG